MRLLARSTLFSIFFNLVLLWCGAHTFAVDIQRFPPPDFESGYVLPTTTTPTPRAEMLLYLDIAVLIVALSIASYLALKQRNRTGLFILTIFSLAYFGFYREGCVCSIGSIQNVTLSFFDMNYVIPFVVIAFFVIPLVYALFFGRVFCAGVCPLGAIQDLMLLRPVQMPYWLHQSLGLFPYIYLGAAVMFAALGAAFVICEYDPFVSFFRLSGDVNLIILGTSLLVISLFVGRPYCLFLCPYGVILRLFSSLALWRVTVSPDECRQCQLCEEACPFGAIHPPTTNDQSVTHATDRSRIAYGFLALPIIVLLAGWIVSYAGPSFSRAHFTVRLAEQIVLEDADSSIAATDASQAFRDSGQSKETLFVEARAIRNRFTWAAWILGGFIGLVVCGKVIHLSFFKKRTDYEIDNASCLACGRCFEYCPVELRRQREIRNSAQTRNRAGTTV